MVTLKKDGKEDMRLDDWSENVKELTDQCYLFFSLQSLKNKIRNLLTESSIYSLMSSVSVECICEKSRLYLL